MRSAWEAKVACTVHDRHEEGPQGSRFTGARSARSRKPLRMAASRLNSVDGASACFVSAAMNSATVFDVAGSGRKPNTSHQVWKIFQSDS
jgi:hypothetical protein